MRLILTQEIAKLGSPGDVVEVKDGYGRNFLVPRGYAIRWTRGAEKQIDTIRRARNVRDIRDRGRADEVKQQLEGLNITIAAQAGANGRLFGAVTIADIVAAVRAAGGPEIDRRRIEVAAPIKTLGVHRIKVKVHEDVAATLNLDIVAS